MNKRVFYVLLLLAVFIITPVILWAVISYTNKDTVEVSVLVVPKDSKVKIGDKEYSNKERVKLKPGDYPVTISKDGFETVKDEFSLDKNDVQPAIIASLSPVSEDAIKWSRKNNSEYLRFEGKVGAISEKKGEEFGRMYPITRWLPLDKAVFVIGYKQVSDNAKDGIVVTIRASEGYREAALQEIRDRGDEPGDYNIEFIDYRNPFNE